MSQFARVTSVEALTEFRADLCSFGDRARDGLATVQMAIQRTLDWIEEQGKYWQREVRRWEEAVRRVKPTPRAAAQFSLTTLVLADGATNASGAVDCLVARFLSVPLDPKARDAAVAFLEGELGTSDLGRAKTYMEDPLRLTAHLIMSTPQYQLA